MQINLAPDPSLLAIVVIFILEYLVVRKFFLQPINNVIDERETERRTAEQLYEEALARFNEAAAQMETQLHGAKRDASTIRDRYRNEAAAHRNQVIERTQSDAKKIVTEAEGRLSEDVKEAREKIVRESESLARLAAERILGRAV
jgi:F-type H+-transporting ATPase subunit b